MSIGEKIKYYRNLKGVSKTTLAKIIEVSPAYITMLENGEKNNPSLEILIKISKALDVKIEDLDNGPSIIFTGGDDISTNELKEFINSFQEDFLDISNRNNIIYDKGFLDGLKKALQIIEGEECKCQKQLKNIQKK